MKKTKNKYRYLGVGEIIRKNDEVNDGVSWEKVNEYAVGEQIKKGHPYSFRRKI